MASYRTRWVDGEGGEAFATPRWPLLPLGLGASLLAAPAFADELAGFWAPFAATLLALALSARAYARVRAGQPPGALALTMALPAPLFVALGSCIKGGAQGALLALPFAPVLVGGALALERAEALPIARGRARVGFGALAALALAGFWGHFWAVDLGHARARVVLAPVQALATAAAAFAIFYSGGRRPSPWRMALGGGALGLGVAFALLAARAEGVGCVGVSPAYQATLAATAILLYGLGPLAAEAA
ncbi:MAG TPA: hypothetical protein VFS43_40150 [Polyangiaceae bacterium]|nr:hypothetical protein [Polyangiaceae bacterium]